MAERMLNKQIKPTAEEMLQFSACGALLAQLNNYLTTKHNTSVEIRFPYGNNYGWCFTHVSTKS